MKVTLLHSTPLWVCARAIRTCWDSHDKSDSDVPVFSESLDELVKMGAVNCAFVEIGEKDKELIERVGNKNKHSSTLEHLTMTFEIDGISRACLQELARHRMASYSVQSSRYVLHKLLKNEEPFVSLEEDYDRASKYVVFTKKDERLDSAILEILEKLRYAVHFELSNDVVKYAMPECFKTRLVWTINARSLQNFLSLRTSRSALAEIRELAYNVFNAIPEEHKYLFEDFLADSANIKDK